MEPISLFKAFRGACSSERLAPYKSEKSEIDALTSYAWNIALSEALYPSLQNLEIGLRNRVDTAIRTSYSNSWWFKGDEVLVDIVERDEVDNAERRLQRRGVTVTPPAIVSELNFGFWARLLASQYDVAIWRRRGVLEASFPQMPHPRRRRELFKRFDEIRLLRNHVFHHESILHLNLNTEHANMMQAMGWLDPSLQTVTRVMDRFPSIYTEDYKNGLKQKLMSACPVESRVLIAARREAAAATAQAEAQQAASEE
jgi:hypothetical protein